MLSAGRSLGQDHEPPAEEMSERYLFRPDFVPGFSDVFKPFFTPTERSKGAR
jgi:hypothetical protein